MFNEKIWPEGYVFPACAECNRGSKEIDKLLVALSGLSLSSDEPSPKKWATIKSLLSNNPELAPILLERAIEIRRVLRELGQRVPDGMFLRDLNIVLFPREAMDKFKHLHWKLFCALYYKHVGEIFPKDGELQFIQSTNQILNSPDPFDWQRYPQIQNQPEIRRAGRDLTDQFDYKWGWESSTSTLGISLHLSGAVFAVIAGSLTQPPSLPEDQRITFENTRA